MEKELSAQITCVVWEKDTAITHKSGTLPVLATPRLIALMEEAAVAATHSFLQKGDTTVGIDIQVQHLAPTVIGKKVTASATITDRKGPKIFFTVQAWDEGGIIGRGTHVRYLVDENTFLAKANERT